VAAFITTCGRLVSLRSRGGFTRTSTLILFTTLPSVNTRCQASCAYCLLLSYGDRLAVANRFLRVSLLLLG